MEPFAEGTTSACAKAQRQERMELFGWCVEPEGSERREGEQFNIFLETWETMNKVISPQPRWIH